MEIIFINKDKTIWTTHAFCLLAMAKNNDFDCWCLTPISETFATSTWSWWLLTCIQPQNLFLKVQNIKLI